MNPARCPGSWSGTPNYGELEGAVVVKPSGPPSREQAQHSLVRRRRGGRVPPRPVDRPTGATVAAGRRPRAALAMRRPQPPPTCRRSVLVRPSSIRGPALLPWRWRRPPTPRTGSRRRHAAWLAPAVPRLPLDRTGYLRADHRNCGDGATPAAANATHPAVIRHQREQDRHDQEQAERCHEQRRPAPAGVVVPSADRAPRYCSYCLKPGLTAPPMETSTHTATTATAEAPTQRPPLPIGRRYDGVPAPSTAAMT